MTAEQSRADEAGDIGAALVVVVVYLGYMLAIAFGAGTLGMAVRAGFALSIGLALGILVVVFLVVMAAAYTYWRNRRDRGLHSPDARLSR